jgi:uncharacterized membrane protein
MTRRPPDLNTVVWSILLAGLVLSIGLIAAGMIWLRLTAGGVEAPPPIAAANLRGFILRIAAKSATGKIEPTFLIYSGIAVLLLTPFARVLASTLYFAFGERNRKFTLITGFVLTVLTVVLFLR